MVIGIALWGLVSYFQNGDTPETAALPEAAEKVAVDEEPPAEADPAPGFQLLRHESGNLSVEVPSEWEADTGKYADFEGKDVSKSEGIGPAITASTDLYAWNNIGGQVPGVYLRASGVLAQRYTDDQSLDSASSGYAAACERGAREDFDRPPYSGKTQGWANCSGTHDIILVAAAPEDRECLLTLQIAIYDEEDIEAAQRILETFEADCEEIA